MTHIKDLDKIRRFQLQFTPSLEYMYISTLQSQKDIELYNMETGSSA